MTVTKLPITVAGYERLQEELRVLRSVERPAVIEAIAEARAHGDLSENAEYSAARERQGFIEGRIQDLEARLSLAEVIDPAKMTGDVIKFGATVTVVDADTDHEQTFQIVGEYEADITKNLLALNAPLPRGLIGKTVGDSIEIPTPKGSKTYDVLAVEYK
jgi:transcription elongation factor GreA